MADRIKLGATLPMIDTGGEPETVAAFAQAAEAFGYDHLCAADHVLGVNAANRPGWSGRNTSADYFHDPFVVYGYLAGITRKIGFSTQVLILAQRQTALVAKQAASLDVLSGGRFRLGVGIGWNQDEMTALGEDFHTRGRRSVEQVEVLRRLWAEDHVTFQGRYHNIPDVGIRPRPAHGIPVWLGGHKDETLKRVAQYGDGWIMLQYPQGEAATAAFDALRSHARAAGRDPASIGLEVWTSSVGTPEDWRAEVRGWKAAGVTHITVNNVFAGYHHKRIEARSLGAHIDAIQRFRDAVAAEL